MGRARFKPAGPARGLSPARPGFKVKKPGPARAVNLSPCPVLGGADSAEWAEDGEGATGGKGQSHGEQSFAQLFEIVEKHPLSRLLTSKTARVAFSSVPA